MIVSSDQANDASILLREVGRSFGLLMSELAHRAIFVGQQQRQATLSDRIRAALTKRPRSNSIFNASWSLFSVIQAFIAFQKNNFAFGREGMVVVI